MYEEEFGKMEFSDVAAFVAILVTGLVLIFGLHVDPSALGGYFLAIGALFGVWRAR